MVTPATTCPQCAQPLTAATTVCPRCGYHVTAAPAHQTDQADATADAPHPSISDPQTQPHLPSYDSSSTISHPSAGPAMPAPMPQAIPDQETAHSPSVAPVPPPPAIAATVTTVTPAKGATSVQRARRRARPSALRRIVRLVAAFVVVFAIVAGAALGARSYLPNLAIVSRFIQASQTTATVVPAGTVLFQDPLTAKAHNWIDDQHCSFASDGYHVRDGYECYAPTAQQSDITLSVAARQLSGPTDQRYGLGLRLNAAGDEYLFAIDSNGHWLFGKYIAGVFTTIVQPTASAAIARGMGSINTLTVRAIGSHFAFAINKTPVGVADDATLEAGYCGVEGSRGIEVVFTSLTIVKAA